MLQIFILKMVKDIDYIIDLLKTYTISDTPKKTNGEMDEQEGGDTGGGGGGKAMPKWADLYATKRGKANMLGKKGEVWSTGLTRGVGNQLW